MAIKTDLELKQYLETNDVPTQQQWWDLVDSKVNVGAAPVGMVIGGTVSGGSPGNILYVGAAGVLAQDGANFNYDYVNKRVGMGQAIPLSRLHFKADTNADATPLQFRFERPAGVYNTNTNWISLAAINGAGQSVGGIGVAQQAIGQGTRLTFVVTPNSTTTTATEGMRLSQTKQLSVGQTILDGAVVDIFSKGNLSTDFAVRVRNNANTDDITTISGDGAFQHRYSFALSGTQIHNAGAGVVINGNVSALIVDPAVLLAVLNVTLPATGGIKDGHIVDILFGGTIAGGATVVGVAGFNVLPNAGQALVGNYPRGGAATKQGGDVESYKWRAATATWYSYARQ